MTQTIPNTDNDKIALIAATLAIVLRAADDTELSNDPIQLVENFSTTYDKLKQVVDKRQEHRPSQPGKRSTPAIG